MSDDVTNNATLHARRIKAYELRLTGKSYRAIGQLLGISHEQARKDCNAYMAATELPLVDEIRKQEVDRLTRYLDVLDARIDEGDDKAVSLAIKISESLRKLLGVDVPVVAITEHHTVSALDMDIRNLIDQQNAANANAKRIAANKGKDNGDA